MVPAECPKCSTIIITEERIRCLEVWQEKQDKLIDEIELELRKIHLQLQSQTVKLAFIIGISQILLAAFLRYYMR